MASTMALRQGTEQWEEAKTTALSTLGLRNQSPELSDAELPSSTLQITSSPG